MTARYAVVYRAHQPVVRRATAFNFPLATPRDYAAFAQLAPDASAPIVLDHAQYFELLAELVVALRAKLGDATRIFVELRMPSVGPLPEPLLRPGVVMGAGLGGEAAFWAAHDAPVVWLCDRIRRELDLDGDNTLSMAVWPEAAFAGANAVLARSWPAHAIDIVPLPAPIPADQEPCPTPKP